MFDVQGSKLLDSRSSILQPLLPARSGWRAATGRDLPGFTNGVIEGIV
jgi:hypothetical protein